MRQAARTVEVSGNHEDPNTVFGRGVHFRLRGDTTFGWRTGTLTGGLDTNGFAFLLETGGGNHTVLQGGLTGSGTFEWRGGGVPQVGPSVLQGAQPQPFTGTFTLSQGVLELDTPAQQPALAGPLVIGGRGPAEVLMRQPGVLRTCPSITFAGPEPCRLVLAGGDDALGVLRLRSHAVLALGTPPAILTLADCQCEKGASLTITGYLPKKSHLLCRALRPEMLARIGFALPDGLFTARRGGDALVPDRPVRPVAPPFAWGPRARTDRERRYTRPGLALLADPRTPLRDGMTISFFGDSLTWLGGYIAMIEKALPKTTRVRLVNRGINGGGVLQLRDGSPDNGFPGSSPQAPFAELLVRDRTDLAVVFIGINDLWWRKTPLAVYEQALLTLVRTAQAQHVPIALATPWLHGELPDGKNPDDPTIAQFAAVTRRVAEATSATWIDLRSDAIAYLQNHNATLRIDGTLYSAPQGILTYDTVHPSAAGVALLANGIAEGIVRALKSKP